MSFRRAIAIAVGVVAVWVGAPLSSVAQDSPAAAPTVPTAGFQDGFFLQSSDGDNRLVLGMVAQTDGRFSLDNPKPIVNTFTIRKLRPILTGRIAKYFDFKFMPDFGNGTAVVQDAYFDIRFSPKFRVRTGQDKTPIGYELLQGDAFLLFPERSLASGLMPNRDIGVQVQGDLSSKLFYAAGVFNGIPDGSSSATSLDTNSGKDVAGRVVVQPFRVAADRSGALNGFGFQLGGSTGHETGALPSFKTSAQQTYFSYNVSSTASGVRTRFSPAVFYYYKAFGGFGEYMQSRQKVARAGAATDVANRAWEVTASIVLTGEAASDRGVWPRNNFDPLNGHWGALQLLARYSDLKFDPNAFAFGLVTTGASSEAKAFSVAVNWYPTFYIKYDATFERTTFGKDLTIARPTENVILIRMQLAF